MRAWHAVLLFLFMVAGTLASFQHFSPRSGPGDRVVVASLPPEPVPAVPDPEPSSPPVYQPGDDMAPAAEVPGVSTEPMPGVVNEIHIAGGLAVFVPRVEPVAADDEPDLGANHVQAQAPDDPPQPPASGPPLSPRPVTRPPSRPRVVPASATSIEVPLPIPAVERPPVEQRWQSTVARFRSDADWRSLVFRGQ